MQSRGGKSQRREEKRREEKKEDQRRERVRRKKMQMGKKVEKLRNTAFFEAAGAEPSGQMRDEKLHANHRKPTDPLDRHILFVAVA